MDRPPLYSRLPDISERGRPCFYYCYSQKFPSWRPLQSHRQPITSLMLSAAPFREWLPLYSRWIGRPYIQGFLISLKEVGRASIIDIAKYLDSCGRSSLRDNHLIGNWIGRSIESFVTIFIHRSAAPMSKCYYYFRKRAAALIIIEINKYIDKGGRSYIIVNMLGSLYLYITRPLQY